MRRPLRLAACLILGALAAESAPAQFTVLGDGCSATAASAGAPVATGSPQVGNLGFSVGFTSPAGSVACFWLWGTCAAAPQTYPLVCGTATCTGQVDVSSFVLGGSNVPPAQTVMPLPIPAIPTLAGFQICAQFLCFSPTACTEFSQTAQVTIVP